MGHGQNILLVVLFIVLAGLSAWLQFGLLEPVTHGISEAEKEDPDYYVEKSTSHGMDSLGRAYSIYSDRMVHYPVGDRVLLDNPIIVQYDVDGTPRRIYAESGWLYNNRSTILMQGNVRVVEGKTETSAGAAMTTKKMVIHLDQDRG